MSKLIKEIMDALNAAQKNKTEPYDRQGEVKRIEGKIAWVRLEGSDLETPVQMTIACDVGDTVQARIGGGSAWLTGNLTAPPTDDKKANQAISMATTIIQQVKEEVDEALEDLDSGGVDDVKIQYCLSNSASSFSQYGSWSNTPPEFVSGKYYWTRTVIVDADGNITYGTPQYSQDTQLSVETDIAFESNNNHFWHDSSGAYVTTANKNYSSGYATRITTNGILQSYNGNLLSGWTSSGIAFYAGDGATASNSTQLASFGSGGAVIGKYSETYVSITSTGSDAGIKFKTKGSSTTGLVIGDFGFNTNTGYTSEGWPEQAWYTLGYRDGYKGYYSTVAGYGCKATNSGAFAGGIWSKAYGPMSFSYGSSCETGKSTQTSVSSDRESYGWASIAMGSSCIAQGNVQIAMGAYNVTDTTSLFILGNGNANGRKNAMTVDFNTANTVIAGTLRVEGHDSPIGTVVEDWLSSDYAVSKSTWEDLCEIRLTTGTWIITAGFRCASNSSGVRRANIGTQAYTGLEIVIPPANGDVTQFRFAKVVTVTSTYQDFYLNVYQNTSGDLTYTSSGSGYGNFLMAVRIA